MKHGWTAATTFVFLTMATVTAFADPDADRCGAAKMKAAGRYAGAAFFCNAAATRNDEAVEPACLNKASVKLTDAFLNAEDAGGCATIGDETATQASADGDLTDVLTALASADNDEARRCAASKTKGAGKHYRALLFCYAKGASRSEAPDPDCPGRAHEKLVKSFSKAESAGGCTTVSDLGAIENLNEAGVEDQVRALSPVCGDGITGPTQECETTDDAMCPGLCNASCICVYPPDCGDGVAELPEECDDGGNADGDGCSAVCVLENASAICAGVASTAGTAIDAVLVNNFSAPVHATAPPLDPSRLFVVEREGRIRIVDLSDDSIEPTAFLDIIDLVGTGGEGGLLSMAFDPDYATNRRFFLNYTNNSGHTTIARYETDSMNANVADESTAQVLLVINQPYANHNGGQIAFGPDGYLYVGMGDGGGGGDPDENGQDDTTLLGKMLRMDVAVETAPYWAVPPTNPGYIDGTSQLELIWAKGMRNPWRFSFDRSNGDLLIADVGQGAREEIDYQSAASTGGENYGWDIFEGSQCYEPAPDPMCPAPPTGFTMPIFEYSHFGDCTSITGGFVYRGCAQPDLAGTYFYSDVCHNFVRTIEISGGAAANPQDRTSDAGASLGATSSFGEDARGELYIVDLAGPVYRIVPE